MFERFRIKTALRTEVIRLREGGDAGAIARAELLFFEAAFLVAPIMKRKRWSAEQAMVFMVTDVIVQAEAAGALAALSRDDPAGYAALRTIYAHVLAKAQADPMPADCVKRPPPGRPVPFGGET